MKELADQIESRTLEQIEGELENVKKAEAAIRDELSGLASRLDQAVSQEARTVSEATRSGKAPKASQTVAKLEQRRRELERQAAVVAPDRLKLEAQRLVLLIADANAEERQLNAAADEAVRAVQQAQERQNAVLTEASFAREHRTALNEQLRDVRRRLAAMGHEDPAEIEERRRDQEEAQRYRDSQAERNAAFNRTMLAEAGVVPMDSKELQREVEAGRVKVHGTLTLRGSEENDER